MEKEADSDLREILFNDEKDKLNTYQKSKVQKSSRSTHPDETIKTENCSGYDFADDRCFLY